MGETLEEKRARVAAEQGERLLNYFTFAHLPDRLQAVSAIFCRAAVELCEAQVAGGPERTVALRKLLEAKDAAVRNAL